MPKYTIERQTNNNGDDVGRKKSAHIRISKTGEWRRMKGTMLYTLCIKFRSSVVLSFIKSNVVKRKHEEHSASSNIQLTVSMWLLYLVGYLSSYIQFTWNIEKQSWTKNSYWNFNIFCHLINNIFYFFYFFFLEKLHGSLMFCLCVCFSIHTFFGIFLSFPSPFC